LASVYHLVVRQQKARPLRVKIEGMVLWISTAFVLDARFEALNKSRGPIGIKIPKKTYEEKIGSVLAIKTEKDAENHPLVTAWETHKLFGTKKVDVQRMILQTQFPLRKGSLMTLKLERDNLTIWVIPMLIMDA
jgi:hypothetical protein